MTDRAKNVTSAIVAVLIGSALMLGLYYAGIASANAAEPDPVVAVDHAGPAVSDPPPAPPSASAAVHDPLSDPQAAVGDLQAMRKGGWPVLVWGSLLVLLRLLAALRGRFPGVLLFARLAKGKLGAVLAGTGTLVAAGYDAIVSGGSWFAAALALVLGVLGLLDPTHPSDR